MKHGAWILLGVAAGVSACSTNFGDVVFVDATSSSGTTTTATSTTGTGTGGAGCDAGTTVCGGVCLDTQADVHNCGRCAHDCLLGACSSGFCQAWPVTANATVTAMATDGKYVVWADSSNGVHQVPVAGGAVVTVMQPDGGLQGAGPVVNNDTVAFNGSDRVYGVPEGETSSTSASLFTNYAPGPLTLGANGVDAYVLGVAGPPASYYLLDCPLVPQGFCQPAGNGSPLNPAPQGALATNLVANATSAFWLYDDNGTQSINRYTFTPPGSLDTFSVTGASLLAIDASNVYWAGPASSAAGPGSSILSLPQSFTSNAMPASLGSTGWTASGLASDGTNVYIGQLTTLLYVPVGGGPQMTTMYTSANDPGFSVERFVVAAGGAVYWADVSTASTPPTTNIMGIATP